MRPSSSTPPWGPVGCAICYDNYCFPELMDYYVAKGCRLCINSTALAHCHGKCLGDKTLQAQVIREGVFIASANLGGLDKDNYFWGGSSIIGPSAKTWEPHYYAGMPFTAEGADEEASTRRPSTSPWPHASSTSTTPPSKAPTGAPTSTSRCSRTSSPIPATASRQARKRLPHRALTQKPLSALNV